MLSQDLLFPVDSSSEIARELFAEADSLPLISPHGHVDPQLFSNPNYRFGSPIDLLIRPDHYLLRMLHSQGIGYERLGLGPNLERTEQSERMIWKLFAENFYLFAATPTGLWLRLELERVFGLADIPNKENADKLYDRIAGQLASPEFTPRALYKRFNLELLSTTDHAESALTEHRQIKASGWKGKIVPTFRPDGLIKIYRPGWLDRLKKLEAVSGQVIGNFSDFLAAVRTQRDLFKNMGAFAADHDIFIPDIEPFENGQAERLFNAALTGRLSRADAIDFERHMLFEMARMSCEDGLVMQLHCGSFRDHCENTLRDWGNDMGADIPVRTEFVQNLKALLNAFGNNPAFRLILFTLDESTYARELAPLAGFYPALRLGPPWWFNDSPNGIHRYLDQVTETAGIYNLAGFNDDTRAFCSIPARHEAWRRCCASWLAGLVVRGQIGRDEAHQIMYELAYGLAKKAYRLE